MQRVERSQISFADKVLCLGQHLRANLDEFPIYAVSLDSRQNRPKVPFREVSSN
jgi:hypothetical protein